MITQTVKNIISQECGSSINLLIPKDSSHGDFAIHISSTKQDPDILVKKLCSYALFEKIERQDSFINLFIHPHELMKTLDEILEKKQSYGKNNLNKNKRIMVEFAHPNTHKLFHIGHLRNITIGETLSRLLENSGAEVIRANYQGDVGLHIAKCLYIVNKYSTLQPEDESISKSTTIIAGGAVEGRPDSAQSRALAGGKPRQNLLKEEILKYDLHEKIQFLGRCYSEGHSAYENNQEAKQEVLDINQKIFNHDPSLSSLWQKTRSWSLAYFDETYRRLDTRFDRLYFESEVADKGLAIAKDALKKSILSESEGAVVFDGTKYGLDTRVFINSLALPTYEAKELGLASYEFSDFHPLDEVIHVVGPEQSSFFKVTFKVEELLDEKTYKDKQTHFVYGFVRLKTGKMSSREGTVIEANWLIDEVIKKLKKSFTTDEATYEPLAISAIKYTLLSIDTKKDFVFDIDESISLHGHSGVYLQYTHARCHSLIEKASQTTSEETLPCSFEHEELSLLRLFIRFDEVIQRAVMTRAPHLISLYLYALAKQFNLFYDRLSILKADTSHQTFRINLTRATLLLLKLGFRLLGMSEITHL